MHKPVTVKLTVLTILDDQKPSCSAAQHHAMKSTSSRGLTNEWAWFTFTADGKPAWYTFQPAWASVTVTAQASLFQSTRPPGASSPPAGANANTTVGVASLDFTTSSDGDEAKLTYTFGSGTQQTRTIKRFKP
jgi:hypothetical protein